MQFSLRILMAFVLLAALLISGWISEQRVNRLSLREILLRLELQETISRVGDFEQQKTLNDRFFEADEKRIREYSSANERFQEIASRYGSLDIADKRKLAIIAVPQWDLPGVTRKAWRVFVPAIVEMRLAVDFLKQQKNSSSFSSDDEKRVLETAQLFKPGDPWSMVLPAGESLIGFQWVVADKPQVKLFCNGVEVQRFEFKELGNGSSSSGNSFDHQVDRDPNKNAELLRFIPQIDTSDLREAFWLRIVPGDPQVNQ